MIRWRDKDVTKLRNYVRKFNASITRFENQHPEYSGWQIPQRLNFSNLQKQIQSRADFNYYLNKIDRWFKKGARELVSYNGILITKWDRKELQYAQQRQKSMIKRFKKEFSTSPSVLRNAGIYEQDPAAKLKSILKDINDDSPNNNYTEENGIQAWRNFRKKVEERGSEKFRENLRHRLFNSFFKTLETVFSEEQQQDIKDLMENYKINSLELYSMRTYYDEFNIDWVYGPEDAEDKYEQIMLAIPKAIEYVRRKK